jgi:hypothetical protein
MNGDSTSTPVPRSTGSSEPVELKPAIHVPLEDDQYRAAILALADLFAPLITEIQRTNDTT